MVPPSEHNPFPTHVENNEVQVQRNCCNCTASIGITIFVVGILGLISLFVFPAMNILLLALVIVISLGCLAVGAITTYAAVASAYIENAAQAVPIPPLPANVNPQVAAVLEEGQRALEEIQRTAAAAEVQRQEFGRNQRAQIEATYRAQIDEIEKTFITDVNNLQNRFASNPPLLADYIKSLKDMKKRRLKDTQEIFQNQLKVIVSQGY